MWRRPCSPAAMRSSASTTSTTITTSRSSRRGCNGCRSARCFQFVRADLADRPAVAAAFRRRAARARRASGRAGRRALLARPTRTPTSTPISSASSTSWKAAATTAVEHLVYASSSSVYGANTRDAVLGAAQRRSPAQSLRRDQEGQRADGALYAHLFGLPVTGLRFFTVYGPWGRPDMALFMFTRRDPRRRADRRIQSRAACARLHLHRRHGGGRRADARQDRCARSGAGAATRPIRPHRRRPTGSTTSATTSRSSSWI